MTYQADQTTCKILNLIHEGVTVKLYRVIALMDDSARGGLT